MKAKHLIEALKILDPEADVRINIMQHNKAYGVIQLPIEYGSYTPIEYGSHTEEESKNGFLNQWVNSTYGGSITVHLPEGAYIAKLPKI